MCWCSPHIKTPQCLRAICHPPKEPMETFTQPKITGYRQLSPYEVALMNEGKALALRCGEFIAKLRAVQPSVSHSGLDQRWVSIGATDLQTGFMAVIRGIAQPTTF